MRSTGNLSQLRLVVSPRNVPDGEYVGTWGGYYVRFTVGNEEYTAQSDVGIRTPSCVCSVRVENGQITVQAQPR